jgi:hypothetical protein
MPQDRPKAQTTATIARQVFFPNPTTVSVNYQLLPLSNPLKHLRNVGPFIYLGVPSMHIQINIVLSYDPVNSLRTRKYVPEKSS